MGTDQGDSGPEKTEVADMFLEWDRRLEAFATELRDHGLAVHIFRHEVGPQAVRIEITITPGG